MPYSPGKGKMDPQRQFRGHQNHPQSFNRPDSPWLKPRGQNWLPSSGQPVEPWGHDPYSAELQRRDSWPSGSGRQGSEPNRTTLETEDLVVFPCQVLTCLGSVTPFSSFVSPFWNGNVWPLLVSTSLVDSQVHSWRGMLPQDEPYPSLTHIWYLGETLDLMLEIS